jgi:hypothetical protein
MQNFSLNISKISRRRHAPKFKPPRKIKACFQFHGLNGKVEIWKGK